MLKQEEVNIQIFDGKDYNLWKKRLLLYLKWKKCDEAARRERRSTEDLDKWEDMDIKAMNYIYCSITNDQLEFVGEEETAYGIIKKFDQLYLKESTALQICIRNKLDKMRLKNYEDSSTFFTDFEKTINELKSAGGTVGEQEKLNYMLGTLPDTLSYIGDLIDAMKLEDRNCEFLKRKISMWEAKDKNDSNKRKASAFKVENKPNVCHGCDKPGHFHKRLQKSMAQRVWKKRTEWGWSVQARRCAKVNGHFNSSRSSRREGAEAEATATHNEDSTAEAEAISSKTTKSMTQDIVTVIRVK